VILAFPSTYPVTEKSNFDIPFDIIRDRKQLFSPLITALNTEIMSKRRTAKRILLGGLRHGHLIGIVLVLCLLTAGIIYVYANLNRLLTNALNNGFNANRISDVYELKFEDLDVNVVTGSVKVYNVKMYPRETPLQQYDYINSTFRMTALTMILKNVDLVKLLRSNKLDLNKIELVEPGIDYNISDINPVFFPFIEKPSAATGKSSKKSIEAYMLKEFKMVNAYFLVTNTAKERKFDIQHINLTLQDMVVDQQPGIDRVSYRHFDFSIGELTGRLAEKGRSSCRLSAGIGARAPGFGPFSVLSRLRPPCP
jgi:hypothetical protein